MKKPPALFLTCEHAGNRIPAPYKKLFAKSRGVLKTHRGLDPGAFQIAKSLARLTETKLFFTLVSRLVVDMNRSPDSETALSKWTKKLPPESQQDIFQKIYWPYRKQIFKALDTKLKTRSILHVGVHSFSPYVDKSRKSCDLGLLFDERSSFEKAAARSLHRSLNRVFPDLRIKMNFPYRGDADGLTTTLRTQYRTLKKTKYAGLEIEMNQSLLRKLQKRGQTGIFSKNLSIAIKSTLKDLDPSSK